MRLAFSTLGCPELSVDEAISLAAQGDWDGLELRSAPDATVETSWSRRRRVQVRSRLADAGLTVVSLSTYLRLGDLSLSAEQFRRAAAAEVGLARDLGAQWVRVFPGGPVGTADAADDALVRTRLAVVARMCAEVGVGAAVETHDSHPRVADIRRILPSLAGVGVIWDVLHPWRHGETPHQSVTLLAERATRNPVPVIQVKDVAGPAQLAPLPLGAGQVPLTECLRLARAAGLTDWVSWEYERAWFPTAPTLASLADEARAVLTGAV